ncbi:MAG: hypothetical protein JWM16_6322 [Verrucomicrobiales bacterium]|nr:hypothetical protein [Verrucomicrobiales bacterium]
MTETTADLFGSVLTDIANGPKITGHADLTGALLRRLSEKGLTLDQCADRRVMARSRRTLEARARAAGVAFADYVPMALRKEAKLIQSGDFFMLEGDLVDEVANLCDVVVTTTRQGVRTIGFPIHTIEETRDQLKAAWYVVKLVRQKKAKIRRAKQ